VLDNAMRILIVSDAWFPQVNGVVRTLSVVADKLRAMGDTVEVIGPDRFRSMPTPGYAEIRLAIAPKRKLARLRGIQTGDYPYRHRRTARLGHASPLPAQSLALHNSLSHAFPGIPGS
jgi:hypothetical protein